MGRKKIVSIKFDKKIYKVKIIKKAMEDYKELADISFKDDKDFCSVKFDNIDKDFKNIIIDEFANYALALSRDF